MERLSPYADDGGATDLHMRYGELVGGVTKGVEGDGYRTTCRDLDGSTTPV